MGAKAGGISKMVLFFWREKREQTEFRASKTTTENYYEYPRNSQNSLAAQMTVENDLSADL